MEGVWGEDDAESTVGGEAGGFLVDGKGVVLGSVGEDLEGEGKAGDAGADYEDVFFGGHCE